MSSKAKIFIGIIVLAILYLIYTSTRQVRTRHLGGSMTIDLPKNTKLVNITWKEDNLWYLTRPMTTQDSATSYQFREDSQWNVMEGTITIIEYK